MGFLLRICFRVWKCRTEKQERNRKRNCGSLWAAVFLVKEHKMDAEKQGLTDKGVLKSESHIAETDSCCHW